MSDRLSSPSRYFKHPTGANWPLKDGRSLNSAHAHLVHSNLSHLAEQNLRHLGTQLGPGLVHQFKATENSYNVQGLLDVQAPDPTSPEFDRLQIGWLLGYDCLRSGPVAAIPSALQINPPGYKVRPVRVIVDALKGVQATSTIYFVVAIMPGTAPPNTAPPLYWAKYGPYASGYGAIQIDTTVVPYGPVAPSREWTCRPLGTEAESTSRLLDLSYWVGWYSLGTGPDIDSVYSASFMEVV